MQPVSGPRIGKYVPVATNINATTELLLEAVFLFGPCKGVIRNTIGAAQSVES
jgi:hypothetical protein